jgi:hypothetical protein
MDYTLEIVQTKKPEKRQNKKQMYTVIENVLTKPIQLSVKNKDNDIVCLFFNNRIHQYRIIHTEIQLCSNLKKHGNNNLIH